MKKIPDPEPLHLVSPLWFEARRDAARFEHERQRRRFWRFTLPLALLTLILVFLWLQN